MRRLAAQALVVLVVAIWAAAMGHRVGVKNTENAWQAKEGKRLQAEAEAREAEIRRGEKASGALQAELLARQITNDQLTKAFNDYKRRHALVVSRCPVGRPPAPPPAAQPGTPEVLLVPVPARDDPSLTHGAVWMWNSALAGRDVPSGACGLADTSEAACAADAGVTVEDAWDNHALNARICAENFLRHQRLIDFINKKGAEVPVQNIKGAP